MPVPKRWFPVSHDLLDDPEFNAMERELGRNVGTQLLRLWLKILSILDRNDNRLILADSAYHSLARTARMRVESCKYAVHLLQESGWIAASLPPNGGNAAVYYAPNFAKYHNTRGADKHAPNVLPNLPSKSRSERKKPRAPKINRHDTLAIPLPDDWTPKETHVRFAAAKGLDIRLEEDHFRGRSRELEWKQKDWDQKFSNWMLQEVKFRRPKVLV